ncbi:pyridoxal-phosphate dependent enzyme [Nocardioides sp. LHD-245]|uniref:pyridoxal-phosphate dependent enzyme n=1 Tax=Nocardioides sp. LHD-245 TaxID=3051387 RepID=UPI0027DFFCEF|nr:pyridoxal-phosphate dependent enzyme [Nocardioides sp. LHD-245]
MSDYPAAWRRTREQVARLPRLDLACRPTPLEEYPRLAAAAGLSSLHVKREDLTGLAFGGNKVRELDLIVADAVRAGADTFVAGGGGTQSNHARQCAAAARRAGLEPVLVLRRTADVERRSGNLLAAGLFADDIRWIDVDAGLADREAAAEAMEAVAQELTAAGRRPYLLRSSFHRLAAAAYVDGGIELAEQLHDRGIGDAQVVVSSMGATRVGLQLAFASCGLDWPVHAMGWRPVDRDLAERLAKLADETAALLGLDLPGATPADFVTYDHGGPAYGVPHPAGVAAATLAAHTEGLLLDPVYTAKAFAGLLAEVAAGRIDQARPVVFVHTGGLPVVFAHDLPAAREEA